MSFEVVVRPAGIVAVLKEKPNSQPIATQDDEAFIEWGSASLNLVDRQTIVTPDEQQPFDWNIEFPLDPLPPFETEFPGTSEEPGENEPEYVFNERARKTHVVRIAQEGKPENYVDVKVIDSIAFDGPDGVYIYRFSNKQ